MESFLGAVCGLRHCSYCHKICSKIAQVSWHFYKLKVLFVPFSALDLLCALNKFIFCFVYLNGWDSVLGMIFCIACCSSCFACVLLNWLYYKLYCVFIKNVHTLYDGFVYLDCTFCTAFVFYTNYIRCGFVHVF